MSILRLVIKKSGNPFPGLDRVAEEIARCRDGAVVSTVTVLNISLQTTSKEIVLVLAGMSETGRRDFVGVLCKVVTDTGVSEFIIGHEGDKMGLFISLVAGVHEGYDRVFHLSRAS